MELYQVANDDDYRHAVADIRFNNGNGRLNNGKLRGYKSEEKNAILAPIKPTISDESITEFLNSNKLLFCSVEFFFDTSMPSQIFVMFQQNMKDLDLVRNALMHMPANYVGKNITEIHITPAYQNLQGYPKVFSDSQYISILSTLVFKTYGAQIIF